jgi:uncharacterized protein (TIGR03089 family)
MATVAAPTVVHMLAAALAARPDQPLITFYDDATGERAELSAATLANWVAKTANMLLDGLGLVPGDVAAVRLPPHWQTAAVLLGCWATGLTIDPAGHAPAAVAFVAEPIGPRPPADEVYALALSPLGMPFRSGPPSGTQDFVVETRPYGDRLPPLASDPRQLALIDGTTHADLAAVAAARGVPPDGRVLIDADADPDPVSWLVAPLFARSSVVVCRNLDRAGLDARLATERAVLLG